MICFWDQWIDMNDGRIQCLTKKQYESNLYHTIDNKKLYKKIINPTFDYGIFNSNVINNTIIENNNTDYTYPARNKSLVCKAINENVMLAETFIVLPFKNALFTICNDSKYNQGYWKDKIQWLSVIGENEIWTESK